MDDLICMVQTWDMEELTHVSRSMLHGLHSVFLPPEVTKHNGPDSIAETKLQKLEGLWAFCKEILGWILDGLLRTIALPDYKYHRIMGELRQAICSQALPVTEFKQLVGKLRHASLAIPASKGLFSPVNEALFRHPKVVPIMTNTNLLEALKDFIYLIKEVHDRPTSIKEIYPTDPKYMGYMDDATKWGAGGVWLPGTHFLEPIVWQVEWTHEICMAILVGLISNSDLELAAELLQWLVLEYLVDTKHITTGVMSDNTPTVHWTLKMSAK